MGAEFCTMTVKGQDKKKAQKEFKAEQESDLYENGHSYSGGFGMAQGLEFESKTFETEDEADEWLCENCKKWEAAKAVSFKGDDGKLNFLIGAWCSS